MPRPRLAISHLKHKKLEVPGMGAPVSTLCWGKISQDLFYKRPEELGLEDERGKIQNIVGSWNKLWRALEGRAVCFPELFSTEQTPKLVLDQ